ncbi:hemolysin III family protein [Streptomyces albidoflavus]
MFAVITPLLAWPPSPARGRRARRACRRSAWPGGSSQRRHRSDLPGPDAGDLGLRRVLRDCLDAVRDECRLSSGHLGGAVLRRLDHVNISLIIAEPAPFWPCSFPPYRQAWLLWIAWRGALAGIAFRVLWVSASRSLYASRYLGLGWAPGRYLPDFLHTGRAAVVILTVTGGLLCSAGAVVYAVQRPNPSPWWFGFHEVFHTLTVAAFTTHYIAISLAVY